MVHSDTLATFTHAVAVAVAIAITAIFSAVLAANDGSDIVHQVVNFLFLIYYKTSSQKANPRSLSIILTIISRVGAFTLGFTLRVIILEGNILCLKGPIFLLNHLCNLS